MWLSEDGAVEDCLPPPTPSLTTLLVQEDEDKGEVNKWRHKLTLLKLFTMFLLTDIQTHIFDQFYRIYDPKANVA